MTLSTLEKFIAWGNEMSRYCLLLRLFCSTIWGGMWQNPCLGTTRSIYIEFSVIQLSIIWPCIKQCALVTWQKLKKKKKMPPSVIIRNTVGSSEWWSLLTRGKTSCNRSLILFSSLSLLHCFGYLQHHPHNQISDTHTHIHQDVCHFWTSRAITKEKL